MRKFLSSPGSTIAETPQQFLDRIFCELPHIDGMFLLAPEGGIVAETAKEDGMCEKLPAQAAEFLRLARTVASAVCQGGPQYLLLKNDSGYTMIMPLGPGHVFVVLGHEHIRPDVIQYSADWIAGKLAVLLPCERL